ncbi:MAG TPA: FadR/GntR family transcriptional regulator [Candidatus Dormibacteraeota bacterium]|nr:FadR/GntR family transcriptional regulator [Candidatus Dormibacteraeota bacterium]
MRLASVPVTRRNTYQLVAEAISAAVSEGRLRPGQRLPPERELGLTYSVGRSSTREAIRVLESQGLIRADGRGGYVVMDHGNLLRQAIGLLVGLERVEVSDLFEVRRTLEIETAGLAARRRSASHLEALSERLDEMAQALGEPSRYNSADIGFHTDLAAATGNRLTVQLMDGIRDAMSRAFAVAFRLPGNPALSLAEHRGIAAAVSASDPELARERMRAHLERVEIETTQAQQAEASLLERDRAR